MLLAAANVNPQDTDLRIALAARYQKGKVDKARQQYLALIKAVPFHEGALTFLATGAQNRKDKPAELKYIQAMIKEIKDTKERRTRPIAGRNQPARSSREGIQEPARERL